MFRSIIALLLLTSTGFAAAQSCSVSGTAYDANGKPMRNAVVRLVNQQTRQASFGYADDNAAFQLPGESGQSYRLDVLGPAYKVTGSLIPTRSVVGAAEFSCRGSEHHDVRASES